MTVRIHKQRRPGRFTLVFKMPPGTAVGDVIRVSFVLSGQRPVKARVNLVRGPREA